jgi:hypothetical protein
MRHDLPDLNRHPARFGAGGSGICRACWPSSPKENRMTQITGYHQAPLSWLAVGRLLAALNAGERPAALRGYACVSVRAVCRLTPPAGDTRRYADNVKVSVNEL